MNIGIDIDDTLNYLYEIKKEMAQNYIQQNNLNFNLLDENAYYLEDMYDWQPKDHELFWETCGEELFLKAPLRPFAKETLEQLKKLGHKIYIVTARSTKKFKQPYELSYKWLVENGVVFDELFVGQEDKSQVCKEKNITIFVDDLPENIEIVSNIGVKTILMQNMHNENFNHPTAIRVYDWKTAFEEILKLV